MTPRLTGQFLPLVVKLHAVIVYSEVHGFQYEPTKVNDDCYILKLNINVLCPYLETI